jgi:trehalose 6-phosphate phosphatase
VPRSVDAAGYHAAGRRKGGPPSPEANWAWFFDIDGTLVEIAQTPEAIVVHDDIPPLISRLNLIAGGAVALITGRAIADVDRLLPMHGMTVAGQHGLEIRTATGDLTTHPVRAESLNKVRAELLDAVAKHPGLIAEHKGLSIALHYRHAPALASHAHRLMRTLKQRYVPDFVIQKGKRVVELKPAGKDKGVAIAEIMSEPPFAGRTPVFIGDDVTDELGFKVVNRMKGHSVKIGTGRTNAKWRLKDVKSLRNWLQAVTGPLLETAQAADA